MNVRSPFGVLKLLAVMLFCGLALCAWVPQAWGQTAPTVVVTTTAATGAGSLADAIAFANANPNTTITFALSHTDPGLNAEGVYVFSPVSQTLSAPMTFDGLTQTARENSNPNGPEISLNGLNGIDAAITIKAALVRWGGTVAASGVFNLQSGSDLRVVPTTSSVAQGTVNGKLNLSADSRAELDAASFVDGTGIITNAGRWVLQGTARVQCSINNSGTFIKDGTGTSATNGPLVSSGSIEVKEGTLKVMATSIGGPVTTTSGQFLCFPQDTYPLKAPPVRLLAGARFSGAGQTTIYGSRLEGIVTVDNVVLLQTMEGTASGRFAGTGKVEFLMGELSGEFSYPVAPSPVVQFKSFTLTGILRVPAQASLVLDGADSGITNPFAVAGGTLINDGVVTLKGNSAVANSSVLFRLTDFISAGNMATRNGSVRNNGRWNIESNVAMAGRAGDYFYNAGTIEGSEGRAFVYCSVINTGTIDARSGTLTLATNLDNLSLMRNGSRLLGKLYFGATRFDGNVDVGSSQAGGQNIAPANITIGPNNTSTSTTRFTGTGQIVFEGSLFGTLTLAATNAPEFVWAGGALRGTLNIPSGVAVRVIGSASSPPPFVLPRGIHGGTLNNAGTITLGETTQGNYFFTLKNSPDDAAQKGVFNNSGTCIVNAGTYVLSDGKAFFNNTAVVEKRGVSSASMYVPFNNSGTVEAKQGNLLIGVSGVNSGLLKSDGTGMISMYISRGDRGILRTGTRTEGRVHFGYTRLDGIVHVTGTCFIAEPGNSGASGEPRVDTLISTSAGQFTGTGVVRWVRGAISGTLNLAATNAPSWQWEAGTLKGTFNVPQGAELKILPADTTLYGPNQQPEDKVIDGGALSNAGTVEIAVGATLDTKGSATAFAQSAGETRLEGTFIGNLSLAAGVLSGTGTVQGDVTSGAGTVSPAGTGIGALTVLGNYTQRTNSKLRLNVNGANESQYDRLLVGGNATLGGQLEVVKAAGYTPTTGTWKVMTYGARTGSFSAVTQTFYPIYNTSDVTLGFDATAPSATIATPANSSRVRAFTLASGSVADNAGGSGVGRVGVRLLRLSDNTHWTGTAWQKLRFEMSAKIVTDAGGQQTWRIGGQLPRDANLLDGSYRLAVVPSDQASNAGTEIISEFRLDREAPVLTITTPSDGSTVQSLPEIRGTASDAVTGIESIRLTLQRESDSFYWSGSAWKSAAPPLETTLAGSVWSRSSNLPAGAALANGSYIIRVTATDRIGNTVTVNSRFAVGTAAARVASAGSSPEAMRSSIVLSSISAQSDGTVRLVFTGALDPSTSDSANYAATVDGQAQTVLSAQQVKGNEVILEVPEMSVDARVEVSFAVRDTAGRVVSGKAMTTVH